MAPFVTGDLFADLKEFILVYCLWFREQPSVVSWYTLLDISSDSSSTCLNHLLPVGGFSKQWKSTKSFFPSVFNGFNEILVLKMWKKNTMQVVQVTNPKFKR